jgi:hypothetical protein
MKALLDKYIQSNYIEASKYAAYFIQRSKLPLNPNTVISNAYLRYCKIQPAVKEPHEVKAYFFHLIKTEILWRDTCSRLEIVTAVEDEQHLTDDNNTDLEDKINVELKLTAQSEAIEIYRATCNDRVKLIFFETYYDKGYNTTRAISSHFDISVFAAHGMIREMKDEINEIYNRLKHEEKINYF